MFGLSNLQNVTLLITNTVHTDFSQYYNQFDNIRLSQRHMYHLHCFVTVQTNL